MKIRKSETMFTLRHFKLIMLHRLLLGYIFVMVIRVNHYKSAFNSQKEKLNILAEMLKISKSGLRTLLLYNRPLSL